jgi:hypothetical protein
MALITTTQGPLEESVLMKRVDRVETDDERTEATEYCLLDCRGAAHQTGQPDDASFFCRQHVHRSVDMVLKRGVLAQLIAGRF